MSFCTRQQQVCLRFKPSIQSLIHFLFRFSIRLLRNVGNSNEAVLFDFTATNADVSSWIESSDTVRHQGMSKATLVLQRAQLFQRAVFFGLLNPQPNGAGFAGVRRPVDFDLSDFDSIDMQARGQGKTTQFKVVLKHHGEIGDGSPAYEQTFAATNEFQIIKLPLDQFKAYWRGQPQPDAPPLDKTNITSFGIQYYGGVYEQYKQSGPATLEIDWIKATRT